MFTIIMDFSLEHPKWSNRKKALKTNTYSSEKIIEIIETDPSPHVRNEAMRRLDKKSNQDYFISFAQDDNKEATLCSIATSRIISKEILFDLTLREVVPVRITLLKKNEDYMKQFFEAGVGGIWEAMEYIKDVEYVDNIIKGKVLIKGKIDNKAVVLAIQRTDDIALVKKITLNETNLMVRSEALNRWNYLIDPEQYIANCRYHKKEYHANATNVNDRFYGTQDEAGFIGDRKKYNIDYSLWNQYMHPSIVEMVAEHSSIELQRDIAIQYLIDASKSTTIQA